MLLYWFWRPEGTEATQDADLTLVTLHTVINVGLMLFVFWDMVNNHFC